MGGLKPIGSEKLEGMDKIRRIMEIARYNENIPTPVNEDKSSEYKLSLADGKTYEIIKERQGYIIKQNISESVSDYIAPMKNRKYYSSYSQALKKMNLMAREFNQIHGNDGGTSLFEQEGEKKKDTKYVIPVSKKTEVTPTEPVVGTEPTAAPVAPVAPVTPAVPAVPAVAPVATTPTTPVTPQPMEEQGDPALLPAPAPDPNAVPAPDPNAVPAPDPNAVPAPEEVPVPEEEPMSDEDMGGNEEEVTFKTIQKLTGKLAQKIRTYSGEEEMSSNNTKYVINSILSALDLTTLEEDDVEDIISRLEGEEEEVDNEEEGLEGEEMDTEGEGMEGEVTEPEAEVGEGYDNFGGAFNDYLGAAYTSKMSDNLMTEFDDEDDDIEYFEECHECHGRGCVECEYEGHIPLRDEFSNNKNNYDYPKHGSRGKIRRYDDEETFEDLFTESKVDKIISNYFAVDKNEKLIKEQKQQQTLRKINEKEVYRLSETIKQERSSLKFMENNPKAILVGATVKKNLVFKDGINEFRITTNGEVI
jgi:hypothetical protein